MSPVGTTNTQLPHAQTASEDLRRKKNKTSVRIRLLGNLACALFTMFNSPQILAEEEIDVGRTAAGQLKVEIQFTQPLVLEASVYPGISGYATGAMGMHSIFLDDPGNDFFQLSTAADFQFILLAKDPGMEVWNDTGSAYMGIGESYHIGPPIFDTHPVWNIVTGTPGNVYSLTLKLHDLNGVYPDSTPFDLSFTPAPIVPGPGPYEINIAPADPLHVTLWWTTNAAGWELQSASAVTTTNWDTVTNVLGTNGTNFVLDVAITDSQKFFRLHRP
jgi:hypothetical protein